MFCPKCGNQVDDIASICVKCGNNLEGVRKGGKKDSGSFGWACLGFFMPIAGILLWIFMNDSAPKSAKKAGIGAIVGIAVSVLLIVLVYSFFIGMSMYAINLY